MPLPPRRYAKWTVPKPPWPISFLISYGITSVAISLTSIYDTQNADIPNTKINISIVKTKKTAQKLKTYYALALRQMTLFTHFEFKLAT